MCDIVVVYFIIFFFDIILYVKGMGVWIDICMELIKNRNDLLRNSNYSFKDLLNNFCCMILNNDRELVFFYFKILKYYKKYND